MGGVNRWNVCLFNSGLIRTLKYCSPLTPLFLNVCFSTRPDEQFVLICEKIVFPIFVRLATA